MNETICHPAWVEGFIEECRNQGFNEKQASAFLEVAVERQFKQPLEKQALSKFIGRSVLGLGTLGLAGYGAKKLFDSDGPGSEGWNKVKQHGRAILDHGKSMWNGAVDSLKIGEPDHSGDPMSHNHGNGGNPNNSGSSSLTTTQVNTPNRTVDPRQRFRDAVSGSENSQLSAQDAAQARRFNTMVAEYEAAMNRGDYKTAERIVGDFSNAGYASNYFGGAHFNDIHRKAMDAAYNKLYNSNNPNGSNESQSLELLSQLDRKGSGLFQ